MQSETPLIPAKSDYVPHADTIENLERPNGNTQYKHEQQNAQILAALIALRKGDFSVRLPVEWTGVEGKIADNFNEVVELNSRMSAELERVARVVGKEGQIAQRASIGEMSGSWAACISSVNNLSFYVNGNFL